MTEAIIKQLLSSEILEGAKKLLTCPNKNIALFGPEGSGLEELLQYTYTREARIDMLSQGYLVTQVNEFSNPETPADVFKTLIRDTKKAINDLYQSSTEGERLKEIANSHDSNDARSDFISLAAELKAAGYRTVFVYTAWENFVFPTYDSVRSELNGIHAPLRELSYEKEYITFVITTGHGLVTLGMTRSAFFDTFDGNTWTFPKLTQDQIRSLITPFLNPSWTNHREICEDIQAWTFGNPKLMDYFLESYSEHDGNIDSVMTYWQDPTPTELKTKVNHLMKRWCAYFSQIKTMKLEDTLYTVAKCEEPSNRSKELKHLTAIGLFSYDEFKLYRRRCDALALYAFATYDNQA